MTYAYDDIVTAKDIRTGKVRKEDIIGKQGWFFDTIPSDMSEDAIEHIEPSRYGVLTDISMAEAFPFYEAGCDSWTCFLPEKKKPYEERQAEWIEANGIEIGDKVKILRKYEPYEDGCSTEMDREGRMDRLIGTVGEVCSIARGSIGVADSTFYPWGWPYFCLEKVKGEPRTDTFGEIARKLNGFLYTRYITLHWWEGRSYIYGWGDRPDYNGETWLWCKARYIYRLELPEGYSPEIEPCFRTDGKIDYSRCIIDFEEEASMEPADTILGAPVYLPFDLSLQEDRDALRDRWIRCRQTGSEYRVSAFKHRDDYGWKAHTPQVGLRDGEQLFYSYEFLDGSPVGKRRRKHD